MMEHPFAELIGLKVEEQGAGYSRCSLVVGPHHLNPNRVVHGAVLYALADTGMGAALHQGLSGGEICATIEIKINYYRPVTGGRLTCETITVYRGRRVANLEASIFLEQELVAKANGSFLIFVPRKGLA